VQSVNEFTVGGSESMLTAVFIVFAAAILIMAIYSIIRYRGLGVTHIFGYLSYMICMLMFIAFLDGMILSASGIAALALTSVLTVLSNYYVFENVRKEFAVGKTLDSAIKDGYKRSLAGLLDTHILLFILGLVLYFVGVGEIVPFAYIFTLGVLMSGIVSLVLTRFYWYCMRGTVRRSEQYKFCGFKREVIDDDED
jgi:preprotein translocase subunit SecD